jgi:hypothetical protein
VVRIKVKFIWTRFSVRSWETIQVLAGACWNASVSVWNRASGSSGVSCRLGWTTRRCSRWLIRGASCWLLVWVASGWSWGSTSCCSCRLVGIASCRLLWVGSSCLWLKRRILSSNKSNRFRFILPVVLQLFLWARKEKVEDKQALNEIEGKIPVEHEL